MPPHKDSPLTLDCEALPVREIHRLIRSVVQEGEPTRVRLLNPNARHNLGVAVPEEVHLMIEGPAGYDPAGRNDGATVAVKGGVGWGVAESMSEGLVIVDGDAANTAAASIRSGTVVIWGNASTRAEFARKGATLNVGGSVGPAAGFLMQKGWIIVCGDACDGVADCMYKGVVYVGGLLGELGSDVLEQDLAAEERDEIFAELDRWRIPTALGFHKLVSARTLWNFHKSDLQAWKAAL